MGESLPKLSDDSSLSINIKWLIQIVIVVGGAVLLYTKLEKRIADLENETKSLRYNQNTYVFPDIRRMVVVIVVGRIDDMIITQKVKVVVVVKKKTKNKRGYGIIWNQY